MPFLKHCFLGHFFYHVGKQNLCSLKRWKTVPCMHITGLWMIFILFNDVRVIYSEPQDIHWANFCKNNPLLYSLWRWLTIFLTLCDSSTFLSRRVCPVPEWLMVSLSDSLPISFTNIMWPFLSIFLANLSTLLIN